MRTDAKPAAHLGSFDTVDGEEIEPCEPVACGRHEIAPCTKPQQDLGRSSWMDRCTEWSTIGR